MAQNDTPGADKATDERALFEAAARKNPYAIYGFALFGHGILHGARTYLDTKTEAAWLLWQECAAVAAVPASEPVAQDAAGIRFRFFKHLSTAERMKVFRVFLNLSEEVAAEVTNHSRENRLLSVVLKSAAAPAPVSGMPDLAKLKSDVMRAANQWASAEWAEAQNIGRGGPGLEKRCNAAELKVYKAIDALAAALLSAPQAPDAPVAPNELEILQEVIRIVRQYPDFDADDNPFSVMMDEALAGKMPTLVSIIDSLANGLMPVTATLPAAPAPTDAPYHVVKREANAPGSDWQIWKGKRRIADINGRAFRSSDAEREEAEKVVAALSVAPVAALPAEQAGELPPLPVYELVLIKQYMVGNYLSVYRGFQMRDYARAALAARQAPTEAPKKEAQDLTERQVADMMKPEMLTDLGHRAMLNGERILLDLPWMVRFANFVLDARQAATEAPKERDNCQMCLGIKGGVKGNENVVSGIVMCDYCSALAEHAPDSRDAALELAAAVCDSQVEVFPGAVAIASGCAAAIRALKGPAQ